MKNIKGDLELTENTTFNESLTVKGNITGKGGHRYSLTVNGDINAGNIEAGNIEAGNINTLDINAWNINAWDINAGNIDALDINARDIKYYAVCFAYKNITCKAIKGRRKNSKHFCLDGKITIKKKE